jgi:hypothetical protein
LFVDPDQARRRHLDGVLDQINNRFGATFVHRAGSTPRRRK